MPIVTSASSCSTAISAVMLSSACKMLGNVIFLIFFCCPREWNMKRQKILFIDYQETEELCKLYARTTGPGTRAIPERHKFFINLGVLINRIAEKCERENGMM